MMVNMNSPGPTMHKHIPMGTYVRTREDSGYPKVSGRVVGIASMHIIFIYIVLLDSALIVDNEMHEAITVLGTQLESVDGTCNWLLSA